MANGKVVFGGSGDYKVSWTTRTDTARHIGYVFIHLTASELSGKALRFEADNLVGCLLLKTVKPLTFYYVSRPPTRLSRPMRRKRARKSRLREPLGRF